MSRGVLHTFTGKLFTPLSPNPDDIDILDIAQGLSQLCRYTGQTNRFYSVAEHSYWVSRFCDQRFALQGLLHDAAEAYLNDIASPLKAMPEYKFYLKAEDKLLNLIYMKYGMHPWVPDEVWEADRRMISVEVPQLYNEPWTDWDTIGPIHNPPYPIKKVGMAPEVARRAFLKRFKELTKGAL